MLLSKTPSEYKPVFRREGVVHEIEVLGARTLTTAKLKEKDKAAAEPSTDPSNPNPSSSSNYKRSSSSVIDPDDAITMRARVIRFKYLTGDDVNGSDGIFDTLSRIVSCLSDIAASEKELLPHLLELATLFASPDSSVSSFELLQSGVVDGLLQYFTDIGRSGECSNAIIDFSSLNMSYSVSIASARTVLRSIHRPPTQRWANTVCHLCEEAARKPHSYGDLGSSDRYPEF